MSRKKRSDSSSSARRGQSAGDRVLSPPAEGKPVHGREPSKNLSRDDFLRETSKTDFSLSAALDRENLRADYQARRQKAEREALLEAEANLQTAQDLASREEEIFGNFLTKIRPEPQSFASEYLTATKESHGPAYFDDGIVDRLTDLLELETDLRRYLKAVKPAEYTDIMERLHLMQAVFIKAIEDCDSASRRVNTPRMEQVRERKDGPSSREKVNTSKLYSKERLDKALKVNNAEDKGEPSGTEKTSRHSRRPRQIEIDGRKYVSLPTAAKTLKIAHMTMYNWATKQEVGDGTPLHVFQDPISKHRFILEEDVQLLANRFKPSR